MNLCPLLENNPGVLDVAAGLFWGFVALGAILAVLIPPVSLSGVPARLWVDLVYFYVLNTLYRILALGLTFVVPMILTFLTFLTLNRIGPIPTLCYSPASTPGVEIQATFIFGIFLFLEYWISLVYLDVRLGLSSIDAPPAELLRNAWRKGLLNPAIPECLLEDIKFAVGKNIKTGLPVSYGGLLFRPRLVLPPDYQLLYPGELLLPVLLHEIALIRRRDSFFLGVVTALGTAGSTAVTTAKISCDTYALSAFVPEIVVHTLCAMLGDARPLPQEHQAFHKQTFELLQAHVQTHKAVRSHRAIRARLLWAAQFCDGGGYFKEDKALLWRLRPKTPRVILGMACILGLSLPLYSEIRESLSYYHPNLPNYPNHPNHNDHPNPHDQQQHSPKLEKT